MRVFVAVVLGLFLVNASSQEPVRLFAAGSLRAAMTEIMQVSGVPAKGTFGPSGLLRERIEKGEGADLFASADMDHPGRLEKQGKAGSVRLFARNRLCALAAPQPAVSTETLLARMLEPSVKLGISTPKADPSGDYAWALISKADAVQPGATAKLQAKALKLTGGPDSPPPPKDRSQYGLMVAEGRADIFLTYCTNALQARAENPAQQVVQVPAALAVGADYGMTVLKGARPDAEKLAEFILSAPGQAILSKYGFSPR
jgi:molybdenum ABC transporter molybdate-binding protein